MITVVSLLLLVGVLGFAVARPRGLPEAVAAVPAAVIVVVFGLVSWRDAVDELVELGPTVGFLAAVLLLSYLADEAGVFKYAGAVAARWSRGSPQRLLGIVFVIASVVTAALSLDATVVLLTPVVFATASTLGVRPKPHVYACNHLANSASLLLPVSNLTNLLALSAAGLSFVSFAGLMALPWLAVIGVEYLILRRFFAQDLGTPEHSAQVEQERAPKFALVVLGLTLAGFAVAGPVGVHPAWVALAGAIALGVRMKKPVTTLVRKANLGFCLFVLALGVVVLAVSRSGFGTLVDRVAPHHADLLGLLAMAGLAAVLANVLNNLPATLMLLPLAAHSPGLVLAVLLGANIGPNLTYVGSLATLLWRRILHGRGQPPVTGEFLRLGALTVPACLIVGVASLWVSLRVSGL
ncbi:ArsB/NhaD family transporter [Winogradskya consettensis]|uniref:Arsenic transporter n=1 Tax=Winogradskya consettensis TaxID=113560 RepID=A0A919SKE0_9ACTN|nr:SLC13 family permease [Actinoplanes consettensis]GIM72578.1 arsenic transporter [Actinoplanes consettensis]